MASNVAADRTLPSEVLDHVVTRTDGVPLFVEELTRMVLESDWLQEHEHGYELTRPIPALAIPATLSDSLMARLDRLAAAKSVAQLGAVIGRQFSYSLLRAVSPIEEDALRRALSRLIDAQMLHQRGVPPHAIYDHGFMAEASYMVLRRKLMAYAAGGYVFDDFRRFPWEAGGGLNYYPSDTRSWRLNMHLMHVNKSPVQSSFSYYNGGLTGTLFSVGIDILL